VRPGPWLRLIAVGASAAAALAVVSGALSLHTAHRALAALALPLFVRGRAFATDVLGALLWGGALAAGTQALAPDLGAAVLGATLAGVLAVLVRASRAGGAA
jgi:hypothetical protein